MVTAALRRVMTEAAGAGQLSGDDVRRGRAEHPVCGDEVAVDLRLAPDGSIVDLAWQARGCPASIAVAATAHVALPGGSVHEAAPRLAARLQELGGLAAHERHAERLVLEAVDRAR